MDKKNTEAKRVFARKVATKLTADEMKQVAGGSSTYRNPGWVQPGGDNLA